MPLRRVVITGLGAVSPLGLGVEPMFAGLLDGVSGVVRVPELEHIHGLGPRVAGLVRDVDASVVPRRIRRSMSAMSVFSLFAAREALAQAGVDAETVAGGRLGVALGSTVGSVSTMEEFFTQYLPGQSVEHTKSMLFFRIMSHSCASNLAQALGITGRVLAPAAACSTGCQAVGLGFETVALGRQDMMLCGGADEFHPLTAATFDTIQAASTKYNDAPQRTPRPFDRDRDGIVCAEGAGVLLLEALDSALARGADILAEVAGFASTSDATSIASPDPEPVRRCMEEALDHARLRPEDIGYVNAHATGTVQGDEAEARAIERLFGAATPVSSLKGHMGHTMAASGALELAACVRMLAARRLAPTRNLDNPAPECSGLFLPRRVLPLESGALIKNNFALGGVNCSVVLRRFTHDE